MSRFCILNSEECLVNNMQSILLYGRYQGESSTSVLRFDERSMNIVIACKFPVDDIEHFLEEFKSDSISSLMQFGKDKWQWTKEIHIQRNDEEISSIYQISSKCIPSLWTFSFIISFQRPYYFSLFVRNLKARFADKLTIDGVITTKEWVDEVIPEMRDKWIYGEDVFFKIFGCSGQSALVTFFHETNIYPNGWLEIATDMQMQHKNSQRGISKYF